MQKADGVPHRIVNPARLTSAREYRGYSKTELARRIGVSVQALTYYEKGDDHPKPENLELLAKELRFEKEYFFGCDFNSISPEKVTFRSRRNLTAKVRDMAVARSKHASDIVSPAFRQRFRLPQLDLPDMSGETPEAAAQLLRSAWNLGEAPIDNMVHLLESKGIEFYWMNVDSACVDALSYWVEDRAFIFLNRFKDAGERARFDVAHELGHLILHRHTEDIADQELSHICKPLDIQSKEIEAEADRFASAFLLPREQFIREAPLSYSPSEFFPLKLRWKTSIQAMIRRAYDLNLFSRYVYEQNCRTISARGWRTKEPHELDREKSSIQPYMLAKLADKGMSANDFARELHLSFTDFFELVPAAIEFAAKPEFIKGEATG